MNLADKIIAFNQTLTFKGKLPEGIRIMNPYRENPDALKASSIFYRKYYSDTNSRQLILGINPGRLGSGATGVPFTDPIRLKNACGIEIPDVSTRELSSVFVYEMIDAFGGPEAFYSRFLISSISPLGFVKVNEKGKEVNYNYYDSKELENAVEAFVIETLEQQLAFGLKREICYCWGTGKNFKYLQKLNDRMKYFQKIIPLEHPRYIMQYKSKLKKSYIEKYLQLMENISY